MNTKHVMDAVEIGRAITRIAHEILEKNKGTNDLAIIGIRTEGAVLADRLYEKIKEIEGVEVLLGVLDITLYRDDLSEIGPQPEVHSTEIDFDISEKKIILVDDVLFTGRTIRCAIDQLIDFGRPQSIQLAVLIDRGHRELPVKADYVGKNVPTSLKEEVFVRFADDPGKDEVTIAMKKDIENHEED
ncbi:MAG: bifunctional pyr operon transcriptional regulator/uracil phosphoribosyltransferase PyrR [Candidatus Omnitrophica bacterium]|nr:bifunctional pyr operon transcriptional regulator/uracil phosphoribosyltransferase PyrR [Candidatus Omnitrophota bacterium]